MNANPVTDQIRSRYTTTYEGRPNLSLELPDCFKGVQRQYSSLNNLNSNPRHSQHKLFRKMSETDSSSESDDSLHEKVIDPFHLEKEEAILKACKVRDLAKLRELSESQGGFLNDEIRQKAC